MFMVFIKYKCMKHDLLKKEENVSKKIIILLIKIKSVFLTTNFHHFFLNVKKKCSLDVTHKSEIVLNLLRILIIFKYVYMDMSLVCDNCNFFFWNIPISFDFRRFITLLEKTLKLFDIINHLQVFLLQNINAHIFYSDKINDEILHLGTLVSLIENRFKLFQEI